MVVDAPMPGPPAVENPQMKRPQEGGEIGNSKPGQDYGEAVNSFNDLASVRPGSGDILSLLDNIADRIEKGEYGPPSQGADRPTYDNPTPGGSSRTDQDGGYRGDHQPADDARNPQVDFNQPQDRPGEGLSGMEGAGGLSNQDAGEGGAPKDILSQGSVDSGDSGSRDIGPELTDRGGKQSDGSDENGGAGGNDQKPKESLEKPDKSYWKRIGDQWWFWKPSNEGQNIPGDNIFKRMERNELTEKDLKNLKEDWDKQAQASAVPSSTKSTSQASPGGSHANPKQTDPSPLLQYQSEIKAREAKWDAVQTWNHQAMQRSQAQIDEMWARLRKMNKG